MQGAPSGGIKVEIEFVAGTWTNVTADFDNTQDIVVTWGQTSEYSTSQVVSLSLQLDNVLGNYTPMRQVLADGVTANPYYPNVQIRKRIRVSYTTATTTYVRFLGYIKSWKPVMVEGQVAKCQVSAASRDDKLGKITLLSPMAQAVQSDGPAAFYALTDAAGSTTADDPNSLVNLQIVSAGGVALSFGSPGPGASGEGTAVKFSPSTASNGQVLATSGLNLNLGIYPAAVSYTVEAWVNAASLPSWATSSDEYVLGVDNMAREYAIALSLNAGVPTLYDYALGAVTAPSSIVDGKWHHIVGVRAGTAVQLWVDGVMAASAFGGTLTATSPASRLNVGDALGAPSRFQGSIGFVAVYPGSVTIDPHAHYLAGLGWVGDTTGQRIQRFLTFAGLTAPDWSLDAGQCIVGPYPTAGVDVVTACRAIAESEGAGAQFYFTQTGLARFCDRTFRKPGAPVLTFDAAADMDGPTYTPSFDDSLIVNQSTVTQMSGPNTLGTFTASNPASVALVGPSGDTPTSYAVSPTDARALAQSHVSEQATAQTRLQSVTLDLYSSQTAGLYDLLPLVQVGSRIRVTNMPKWSPTTQLDVIVEGATETFNVDKYEVVFATSAADNPARMVWDDSTYGRWQANGNTLNAARTAAAGNLTIVTVAGMPTFTTNAAAYPLNIQIDQEVITLTAAPGSSTSPQAFTGILRGQKGTPAAAHAAGAKVDVWPTTTWTL